MFKLIEVLERLRDEGNTIIVIEHNLDMIKRADYIIDLGPEGGINGGKVIAGTQEEYLNQNYLYWKIFKITLMSVILKLYQEKNINAE